MRPYSIALIPGDGIGVDVIREGNKVLDTIADIDGSLAFPIASLTGAVNTTSGMAK